ncbi:hypothetical protein [uncultured Eudoraea sp.]|uniref:hypothetical protein n=1 Tax=uncultured Eudoraea sp. TaxID=1035614 RepID=UPI0026377FD1|nr:hypothetical protein [uncultured Eudoraea sp.]
MKEGAVKIKEFQDQLAKEQKAKANQKKSPTTSEDYSKKYLISKGTGTKFENWTYGEAEVVLVGMTRYPNSPGYTKKIGVVESNGRFTFDLPEKASTHKTTVADARWVNCMTGTTTNQKWTNPSAGYLRPDIRIMKNGEELGNVWLSSSNDIIDGWTTANDYYGIPGHRMQLVYVSAPSNTEAVCTIERGRSSGKDFDLYKKINVQFKKGWNLVKTTFEGERIPINWGGGSGIQSYYKDEKITAVQDLSSDTKWLFYPNWKALQSGN